MNSLDEIEAGLALACLLSRQRVLPSRLFDILITKDEAIESVDGLALVSGRLALGRVEAESIVRAACVLLVGAI